MLYLLHTFRIHPKEGLTAHSLSEIVGMKMLIPSYRIRIIYQTSKLEYDLENSCKPYNYYTLRFDQTLNFYQKFLIAKKNNFLIA